MGMDLGMDIEILGILVIIIVDVLVPLVLMLPPMITMMLLLMLLLLAVMVIMGLFLSAVTVVDERRLVGVAARVSSSCGPQCSASVPTGNPGADSERSTAG